MRKLKKFLAELLIACMVFTSVPLTAFAEGTGEKVFVNKGEKLDRKCSYKLSCEEGVKVATGSQVSLTIEENPGWVLAATPSMRQKPGGPDVAEVEVSLDEGFYFYVRDWGGPTYIHLDLKPEYPESQADVFTEVKGKGTISDKHIGGIPGSTDPYYEGEVILLDIMPSSEGNGWKLDDIYAVDEDGAAVDLYEVEDEPYDADFYCYSLGDSDITVHATFAEQGAPTYDIDYEREDEYGFLTVTPEAGIYEGETVFVTQEAKAGGIVKGEPFVTCKNGGAPVEVVSKSENEWQFTMPADGVKVQGYFGPELDGDYVITYLIADNEGGYVLWNRKLADGGEPIYVKAVPYDGFSVQSVHAWNTASSGQSIELFDSEDPDYDYTFKMPSCNVTVCATFAKTGHGIQAKFDNGKHADVFFNKVKANPGETITFSVENIEEGYEIADITSKQVEIDLNTCEFEMPDKDVTLHVTFKEQHTIQAKFDDGKHADINFSKTVANSDEWITFTVENLEEGYRIDEITSKQVEFAPTGNPDEYGFLMPDENVTFHVTFMKPHKITTEYNDQQGSVKLSSEKEFLGETINVQVTAYQGYEFSKFTVTGAKSGTIAFSTDGQGEDFSFVMPRENVTVKVEFRKREGVYFTLTPVATTHGSFKICNANGETINQSALGEQIRVYFTPEAGYHRGETAITTDGGKSVGIESIQEDYISFTMPNDNVTVAMEFSNTAWTVSKGTEVHGTFSLNQTTAVYNEPIVVTVVPETGYHYNKVTYTPEGDEPVDASRIGTTDQWMFYMPDSNAVVDVEFLKDNRITYQYDDTKCELSGVDMAEPGETVSLDITYERGYKLKDLSVYEEVVGGTTVPLLGEEGNWYFEMPNANVVVVLECQSTEHSVTYQINNEKAGTVTLDVVDEKACAGDIVTVECTPNAGYKFVSIAINEGEVSYEKLVNTETSTTFTFVMPDEDAEIYVCYDLDGTTWDVSFVDFDQTFVKSYSIVDGNGAPVVVIDGVAKALPETMLTAKLVLAPGCELDHMVVSGIEDNGQYDFDDDHNRTWTINFEMPNNDVTFDGDYSTFQWNVSARVNDESLSERWVEASITADLGKDLSGNYIAHYGDTVVLHADYDVDDTAEILVKDINGNIVPASADEAKKTWTFTMPNSEAFAVETVSPVVHTINADMSQSNGTYQVCYDYEGDAPASADVRGTQLYVVTSPDAGYEVASVTIAKGSGDTIPYSVAVVNQRYAFTIPDDFTDPADTIEIAVTFQETIAKICQDAIKALVDPAAALKSISGDAADVLANVGAAKDQAHTDAKREALKAAGDALQFAKNNVDGMAAVIADLKADSEELRDKTEKTAEDRTAAEGYRNAARIYAGSYTVLVDACNTAITGTEAPLAIVERSVTFNTNGGSEVASQWVVNNSKASKPNAPTKQGYYFVNWYSDASLTNAYDFKMPVDRDITIFAKWNANSSGGSGGSGGSGAPVKAKAPTYSANWYVDAAGTWRIKNSAGQIVASAWLCDDAVAANGQNVWYLLDTDGSMIAAGLVQDATGHFYSIETNHNGYYGMLRYQDGYYDCNGRQVYLQFSRAHDGSFGAIINAEGLAALREIYGVKQFGINNSNCVYTKTF